MKISKKIKKVEEREKFGTKQKSKNLTKNIQNKTDIISKTKQTTITKIMPVSTFCVSVQVRAQTLPSLQYN